MATLTEGVGIAESPDDSTVGVVAGMTFMDGSIIRDAPWVPAVVPAESDVRAGVAYIDSYEAARVGTVQLPAEALVEIGTGYGADGTELTGTMISETNFVMPLEVLDVTPPLRVIELTSVYEVIDL